MAAREVELWGGPECTVNRVGNRFGDQLVATGHASRDADLERIAGLGVAAVRYPLLWERIAPDRPDERDWRWTDGRLARLRALGIRPIAGLVHHSSGPRYTDLLAENFASGLAAHASATAQRYPWIDAWTPLNEPVTTARFSALYGLWYPHVRDERSFWLALLNQIDGTRAAMAAVRKVNASAQLIQTDDLGRSYATAAMRDQAAFDNARRWAGWDLLTGRVTKAHPLWERLSKFGFADRLRAIADHPCPPDIVGVNHYLTSDRFLDHRVQRYPGSAAGSNGSRSYADVEAVRVLNPPPPGFEGALREAWERYRIPVALTEVHNGCTRDEQMRWVLEAWRAAGRLRAEGADVRAITIWSLFGGVGWDRLLTGGGHYESGVFDVRGGLPRKTALADLLRGLGEGTPEGAHPVLEGEGWWRRPIRLHHPVAPRAAPLRQHPRAASWDRGASPPLLIAGATGTLGRALAAACRHRAIRHILLGRAAMDLSSVSSINAALDAHRPWAVLNATGWVRVDDAEADPDGCFQANATGAIALAAACAARNIPTVSFSSDLVFDGACPRAYVETDRPAPLNVYGRSKAAMEDGIAALAGAHLVVRTAAFFSPFDPHNFAMHLVERLARGEPFAAAADQLVSPTYVPHFCDAVLDLAIDGAVGLWHLSNGEALSWAAFARRIADAIGRDPAAVHDAPGSSLGWRAPRPVRSPLGSARGMLLPSLDEAIACFARDFRLAASASFRSAGPESAAVSLLGRAEIAL